MNASTRFLTIYRCEHGHDVAGVLMSAGDQSVDHESALLTEMEQSDSAVREAYFNSVPGDDDQFEVYAIGRGNENAPEVYDPGFLADRHSDWF